MQVIFCDIPARATLSELLKFATSNRVWNPFDKGLEIRACEILEIVDARQGEHEYHGLVTFLRPQDGELAIKRLNGKRFLGRPVTVREYVHRAPGDRRIDRDSQGLNRPEERRRTGLSVSKRSEHASARGYEDFVQKHGGR